MENPRGPEVAVNAFADFVNSMSMSQTEDFANAMLRQHRTLQQSSFRVMMKCIEVWANAYDTGNYDLRNEDTVRLAKEIQEKVLKNSHGVSYI